MEAKARSALHAALRTNFGPDLDKASIERAEQEYENIVSMMQGCGNVTGLVSKWLFLLVALDALVLIFAKQPIFDSKYLIGLLAFAAVGLTVYGTSAMRESKRIAQRQSSTISFVIEELKELNMGDTNINNGQAAIVGSHGHAHDMALTQAANSASAHLNLTALSEELSKLLPQLAASAVTTEHFTATGEVAKARDAAAAGDGAGALKSLTKAGKWALEVAEKIGVKVASDAITAALGLK